MVASHRGEDFLPHDVDGATDARPGSREKMAVLRHRAVLGLELWNPADCGMEMNLRDVQRWIDRSGG